MKTAEKKAWYKKWWIWVIIVIILIAIGSSGNKDNSDEPIKTATGQQAQNASEKTVFKIGDTASFDDKSITVTDVKRNYSTGNQFLKPEAGKEFVIVTVQIKNNSQDTLSYNTFDFKMQDSNGVQQSEAFTALTQGKLNSGSLAPGGKISGKLAYEVPKGDNGLKLLYESLSFFDNRTVTFDLK